MYAQKFYPQFVLIFLTIPDVIISGPFSNPEISTKPGNLNNDLSIHQQQQQKISDIQNAQLNTLNAYASNYEVMSNKQSQNYKFKPSHKLPEMETNFIPIRNNNSSAPEFTSSLGSPVLMQYLPQTIHEGGIQYLQLIPTRPLMVPIGPYFTGNTGVQSLVYHSHLAPSDSIDYETRPLLSPLPANMPPPAPSSLVDVSAPSIASYNIQSNAVNISPYKQNHRMNRETKDKQLLGPISLNLNEYIPQDKTQQYTTFNSQGRL